MSMDDFVIIYRDDSDSLDWGRISADSLSEAKSKGRKFGVVKLIFPLSDLRDILHGREPSSGRVDADVFDFVQEVSSSIKPLIIRISSAVNPDYVSKAVTTVKRFLDHVGAWYKHHKSKKSDSEYFLVERPNDRMSPEVDVRVSDHNLPRMYDQPDLDIDPTSPGRSGSYSVPEAIDLLEGFFDGEYSNIVGGEPIVSSRKSYPPLYSGSRRGILSSTVYYRIEPTDPAHRELFFNVNAILEGVDEQYFPSFVFQRGVIRGNEFMLVYIAEGEVNPKSNKPLYRLGVVCGSDGKLSKAVIYLGGKKTKYLDLSNPNLLKEGLNLFGASCRAKWGVS